MNRGIGTSRPIAVDLFCGVGGLSLGIEQAGFDVVAALDNEAVSAALYSYNFPMTAVLLRSVDATAPHVFRRAIRAGLLRHGRDPSIWDGEIDLVAGGPPCQGFSVIGQRDAREARNKLVYAFCRSVLALRPKYFLMENVPGMAIGEQAAILGRLVARLEDGGYQIVGGRPQTLNAAHYGVPQDRTRLFIVGARAGLPLPMMRAIPMRDTVTVNEAIGDIPNADDFRQLLDNDSLRISDRLYRARVRRASEYARKLMDLDPDPTDFSYHRAHDPRVLSDSLRTIHSDVVLGRFRTTPADGLEPVSRFHRLPLDGLANTIRAGTGQDHGSHTSARPIHPIYDRVITVREAARLQSFPDSFHFHVTKWHGFREVGNAVPPLLARAIVATIARAMGTLPHKPSGAVARRFEELRSMNSQEARKYFATLRQDPDSHPATGAKSAHGSPSVRAARKVAGMSSSVKPGPTGFADVLQ